MFSFPLPAADRSPVSPAGSSGRLNTPIGYMVPPPSPPCQAVTPDCRPAGVSGMIGPMRNVNEQAHWLALALVLGGCAGAPRGAGTAVAAVQDPVGERPRLVVMVVVDQLAAHLLDRYADVYTGGFRRLLDGGYRFTQATHAHAVTETAAGHASLATGVFPSRHGIVANDWLERSGASWRSEYSYEDTTAALVDAPWAEGRSPVNLMVPAFADWLRASDDQAKIASLSRKDRGAIPLAGHVRGDVYWMDAESGRFVTSRYYRSSVPDWVGRVNEGKPVAWADTVWSLEVPGALVSRARADSAVYEGDGEHVVFPHRLSEERADTSESARNAWLLTVPFPDAATLALAKAAVSALDLGADERTDYLAVSFSQTDAIGHDYGPTSLEQLDNLLRVDRLLGELLAYLDERVGENRWVLALSADHGVMIEPEVRRESGQSGERFPLGELRTLVQTANTAAGTGDIAAVRQRAAVLLEESPAIEDVMLEGELRSRAAPADSFIELQRHSYYEGRLTGWLGRSRLWLRFAEGMLVNQDIGSSHGSAYWYDRHVPLIFYGAGIEAGETAEPARTVDVAPTLARLIGLSIPDGLDGRPLAVPRR